METIIRITAEKKCEVVRDAKATGMQFGVAIEGRVARWFPTLAEAWDAAPGIAENAC
jgi:hypothetical protein